MDEHIHLDHPIFNGTRASVEHKATNEHIANQPLQRAFEFHGIDSLRPEQNDALYENNADVIKTAVYNPFEERSAGIVRSDVPVGRLENFLHAEGQEPPVFKFPY